ncbi:MAG: hypothetical protein JWN04_325 [Myxococcaceae bacterium]|nr:hypothetical protein [Myxococcaceae bacterium]
MQRFFIVLVLPIVISSCALSAVTDLPSDAASAEPSAPAEDGEFQDRTDAGEGPIDDQGDLTEPAHDAGLAHSTAKADAAADASHAIPASGTASKAPSAATSLVGEAVGTCHTASDCKVSCIPIGILNCCRADNICGCTWAPGAYCL